MTLVVSGGRGSDPDVIFTIVSQYSTEIRILTENGQFFFFVLLFVCFVLE